VDTPIVVGVGHDATPLFIFDDALCVCGVMTDILIPHSWVLSPATRIQPIDRYHSRICVRIVDGHQAGALALAIFQVQAWV
jgi:hypothetical protein